MSKKDKIVSIEIELEDFEPIKFTMKEAKELYSQLHELFGEKQVHQYWYPWYQQPWYTYWQNTSSPVQTYTVSTQPDSNATTVAIGAGMSIKSSETGMVVNYN